MTTEMLNLISKKSYKVLKILGKIENVSTEDLAKLFRDNVENIVCTIEPLVEYGFLENEDAIFDKDLSKSSSIRITQTGRDLLEYLAKKHRKDMFTESRLWILAIISAASLIVSIFSLIK